MKFSDYLQEELSPEIQTTQMKADARTLIQKTRGMTVGRSVSQAGKEFEPVKTDKQKIGFSKDKDPIILKNLFDELVYADKDPQGNLTITMVNKRKQTKRSVTLDSRSMNILKRYI